MIDRLRLQLLGGFRLATANGDAVAIPQRKGVALLAYLGATIGSFSARDRLAALLWSQSEQRLARQSLRQTLQSLGHALTGGSARVLRLDRQWVGLDADHVAVDAAEFETFVSLGNPVSLAKASTLYQGEFLAGLSVDAPDFEEWLAHARGKYRDLALDGLTKLVEQQNAAGAYGSATESAKHALRIDPFREDMHRSLMRMYVARGMRAAALSQYRECETTLRRELGVSPDEETSSLYDSILARGAAEPQARLESSHHHAPAATSRPADSLLIGFDRERDLLSRSVSAAADGGTRMVVISGEAGAGKSALLRRAQHDALCQGAILATVRVRPAERRLNFAFWAELLNSPALEVVGDRELKSSLIRRLAFLRGAKAIPNRLGHAIEADNRNLFDAVVDLLRVRSHGTTLVLTIEDMHNADAASVRLLSYVLRNLDRSSVIVLATLRSDDLATRRHLVEVLNDLDRDGLLQRMPLPSLGRTQVEELVNMLRRERGMATLPRSHLREIWSLSDGNPGIVVEFMRGRTDDATADISAYLPESLHADLLRRIEKLDESARLLAGAASVIEHGIEHGLLARATGLDEGTTLRGVEALIAAGLLAVNGNRLVFARGRLRLAQYRSLLPARRQQLHLAVAAAIADSAIDNPAARYATLVPHYTAAGRTDDALGSEVRLGQTYLRQGAYGMARRTFQHVLRMVKAVAPDTVARSCEIEARLGLAEIEEAAGRIGAALTILRGIAEKEPVFSSVNPSIRFFCARGRLNGMLGNDDLGSDYIRRAVASANGEEPSLWQPPDRILEMIHLVGGSSDQSLGLLAKARVRVSQRGFVRDAAFVSATLGLLQSAHGNTDVALTEAHRAVETAVRSGDGRLLAISQQVLGIVQTWCGDPTAGLDNLDDAFEMANVCGDVLRLYQVRCHKGHALIRAGRWALAIAELDTALAMAEKMDIRFARPLAHAWKAWAIAEAGDPIEARTEARAALKLAAAANRPWAHSVALRALAVALAHPGVADWAGAERAIRAALEEQHAIGLEFERASSLVIYAKLLRSAGETQRSKSLVSQAQALFRRLKMALSRETLREMTEILCNPCRVSR